MSGTDFLIGKILGKGKRQSIAPEGIAVTREQIDDAIAATAGAAKKMASGVSLAKRQLDEIRSSGLTGEALVVLVHSRCLPVKNARRPHVDSVSRAGSGRARGALLHRRARAIAPSADKAMKLGVTKLKDERKYPPIKGERMRFFRFQFEVGGRRHQLDITWHTRAGAWEAALRWAKKLQKGELACSSSATRRISANARPASIGASSNWPTAAYSKTTSNAGRKS